MGDYDNVYLIPAGVSGVNSRNDVDLTSDFMGLHPIMSAPMDKISGVSLVNEMAKNNCFGILHRFNPVNVRKDQIRELRDLNVPFGVAIGINNADQELEIAKFAIENHADLICVDIANGYIDTLYDCGSVLREDFGNSIALMAGNVITKEGAKFLKDSGFNFVRVGIGSGSLCTTRLITGIGRNQLAALHDCYSVDVNLVSDGGISIPGNAVKSFAVGADFVMLGGALAYAKEADNNGIIYGMASAKNHEANNKEKKSIEGKEKVIEAHEKRPLKEILDEFLWGIRSACTYLNCKSYKEIPYKAVIVEVDEKI